MKTRRPLRAMGPRGAAVGVERVVDRELARYVFVVVAADLTEATGHGVESPGLLGDVPRVGVGPAHDAGQRVERRVGELVLVEEGVEGALVAVMPQLRAGHVKGDGAFSARRLHHLAVGDEEELGRRIDEAPDQPGAGDAVHAGLAAGAPPHWFGP